MVACIRPVGAPGLSMHNGLALIGLWCKCHTRSYVRNGRSRVGSLGLWVWATVGVQPAPPAPSVLAAGLTAELTTSLFTNDTTVNTTPQPCSVGSRLPARSHARSPPLVRVHPLPPSRRRRLLAHRREDNCRCPFRAACGFAISTCTITISKHTPNADTPAQARASSRRPVWLARTSPSLSMARRSPSPLVSSKMDEGRRLEVSGALTTPTRIGTALIQACVSFISVARSVKHS